MDSSPRLTTMSNPSPSHSLSGARRRGSHGWRRGELQIRKTCDECRRRKVKCDNSQPKCAACVRRKHQCTYPRDGRYRRSIVSMPMSPQDTLLSHPVDRDSPCLGAPDDNNGVADNPSSKETSLQPSSTHNSDSRPSSHIPASSFSDKSLESNVTTQGPNHAHATSISYSEYPSIGQIRNEADPNVPSHLDLHLPRWVPKGAKDGLTIVNDENCLAIEILGCIQDASRPLQFTEMDQNEKIDQWTDDEVKKARLIANAAVKQQQEARFLRSKGWEVHVDFDGIDPSLAMHLLDLHWNTCHLSWLITYRPAIMESLLYGGPHVNKLLLNAIYFSSSLYTERTVVCSDPGDRSTAGLPFYHRFRYLLVDELGTPSSVTAVALLLCTTSLVSRGMVSDSLIFHQMARQMITELDRASLVYPIDVDSPRCAPELSTDIETESRKRLYLGLFSLDVSMTLYLGHYPTTLLDSAHRSAKILDTFEELQDWLPYIDPLQSSDLSRHKTYVPMPMYAVSTFVAQISLYEITSTILCAYYNNSGGRNTFQSSWEMKTMIDEQLSSWKRSLPAHLQFGPELDPPPPPHQIELLIKFHTIKILSGRPFLERNYLRSCLSNEDISMIEDACAEDASLVWRHLSKYRDIFSLRRSSLLLSFCACVAVMVFMGRSSADGLVSATPVESLWSMLLEIQAGPTPGLRTILAAINRRVHGQENNPNQPYASCLNDNGLDVVVGTSTGVAFDESNHFLPMTRNRSSQSIAQTSLRPRLAIETQINLPQAHPTVADYSTEIERLNVIDVDDDVNELAVFVNLFCPRAAAGSSIWLRDAVQMMKTKPLLRNTMKAVSKFVYCKLTGNLQPERSGQQLYISVLGSVNRELSCPTSNTSTELFLTILLLSILELYRQNSEGSLDCHWQASLSMLERRGPLRHTVGIEHSLFVEFRVHWVIKMLVSRRSTFLSREEWKSIPWQGPCNPKDALQQLLDHVVEIPALLEQFDQYTHLTAAGSLCPSEITSMRMGMSAWSATISSRLSRWKRDYADTYPDGPEFRASLDHHAIPVFRCWNSDMSELVSPPPLFFSNPTIATSLCIYNMAVLLLSTIRTSSEPADNSDHYFYACNICRSVSYFFQWVPNPLIMKLVYPLVVAGDAFQEGSVEKEFVKQVMLLIASKHHLEAHLEWHRLFNANKRKHSAPSISISQ